MIDLPRSTDTHVCAVVFVLGSRLGAPVPSEQSLPLGFELPDFLEHGDGGSGDVRLTYTAFEFVDWLAENKRRKMIGEPLIPGFVFRVAPASIHAAAAISSIDQSQWSSKFFDFYFGPKAIPIPGLRLVQSLEHGHMLPETLFAALAKEFDVSTQIPWRMALRGLQRYESEHRHVYFGREAELEAVATKLFINPMEQVLIVDGPSGVGKSSFVRAGIAGSALDNLFHEHGYVVSCCRTPFELTPPDAQVRGAAAILASAFLNVLQPTMEHPRGDGEQRTWTADELPELLRFYVAQLRSEHPEFRLATTESHFVFVLDQAEQALDMMRRDGAAGIWGSLLETLVEWAERGIIKLVFCLPTDRLAEWQGLDIWQHPLPRVTLVPLSATRTQDVITKIAQACTLSNPNAHLPAFLEQASTFVGAHPERAGALLPLLSSALRSLFETMELEEGPFREGLPATYVANGVERVFSSALSHLAAEAQVQSCRCLLQALVTFDTTLKRPILLSAERGDLANEAAQTAWDIFIDAGFLVPLGEQRYRLVHEAVLDHWSVARDWLHDEEVSAAFFDKLVHQARNWQSEPDFQFPEVSRDDLWTAIWFLTERKGLLAQHPESSQVHDYVGGLVEARYCAIMDSGIDRASSNIAAWAILAGLGHVAVNSIDAADGEVGHLETGKAGALYAACLTGNRDVARILLEAGCDPDHTNWQGWNPIHVAANLGDVALVELLINSGADFLVKGPGETTVLSLLANTASDAMWEEIIRVLGEQRLGVFCNDLTLMTASQHGNAWLVRKLLKLGWDPRYKDHNMVNALHLAALNGHAEIINILLDAGLDPFDRDINGWTAFHSAVRGGADTITLLLRRIDATSVEAIAEATSLLIQAVRSGDIHVLRAISAAGLVTSDTKRLGAICQTCFSGRNAEAIIAFLELFGHMPEVDEARRINLAEAIQRGDVDMVDALTRDKAVASGRGMSGTWPLQMAIGKPALVATLLRNGADPCQVDDEGSTAFHLAAQSGDVTSVRAIHALMGDIDRPDSNGDTALHLAVSRQHNVVVQELLSVGADCQWRNRSSETPLHRAASNGMQVAAGIILTRAAYADPLDDNARTPLFRAAQSGQGRMVELLLSYGAIHDAPDFRQETPLSVAARGGHREVVERLLQFQAHRSTCNVDHRDSQGWTALHLSIAAGHPEIVRVLLSAGADPHLRTVTPELNCVQIACEAGASDSLLLLVQAKADLDQATKDRECAVHVALGHQNFECCLLLLQYGAAFDRQRLATLAESVWVDRRAVWPKPTDAEAQLYNELCSRNVLGASYRTETQSQATGRMYHRLAEGRAAPWTMPALIPGAWRIAPLDEAGPLLQRIVELGLDTELTNRIDGIRSLPLSSLVPVTSLIECRLAAPPDRVETLLFLQSKLGLLHCTSATRIGQVSGLRVVSQGEEFCRLAVCLAPLRGGIPMILDQATRESRADRFGCEDVAAWRDLETSIRLTDKPAVGGPVRTMSCMLKVGETFLEADVDIADDGSITIVREEVIPARPQKYREMFDRGRRVIELCGNTSSLN